MTQPTVVIFAQEADAPVDAVVRELAERGVAVFLSRANGELVFTDPKTPGSAAGVGLSHTVVAAFKEQWNHQTQDRVAAGDGYEDDGLVLAREDGTVVRPQSTIR